jgi:hypothetical protein
MGEETTRREEAAQRGEAPFHQVGRLEAVCRGGSKWKK